MRILEEFWYGDISAICFIAFIDNDWDTYNKKNCGNDTQNDFDYLHRFSLSVKSH